MLRYLKCVESGEDVFWICAAVLWNLLATNANQGIGPLKMQKFFYYFFYFLAYLLSSSKYSIKSVDSDTALDT